MSTYSLENLPLKLDYGDLILFRLGSKEVEYIVRYTYLEYPDGPNDYVFRVLGISKIPLLTEAYGYPPDDGQWPETVGRDFDALTRAAWALFSRTLDEVNGVKLKSSNMDSLIDPEGYMGSMFESHKHLGTEKVVKRVLSYSTGFDFNRLCLDPRVKALRKSVGKAAEELKRFSSQALMD